MVVVHGLGLSEVSYRKMLDAMLGVSAGVMTAASYWSLLAPALEFASEQGWGDLSYVPVAFGFLSGGALIQGTDKLLDYLKGSLEELDLYKGMAVGDGKAASRQQRVRRLLLLIIAITIHNFPEGLAVGMPLMREGVPPLKAFWYGQLSGIVEPIGGCSAQPSSSTAGRCSPSPCLSPRGR